MLKWTFLLLSGLIVSTFFLACTKKMNKKNTSSNADTILVSTLRTTGKLALKRPSEYCLKDGYIYSSTKYHADYLNIYSTTVDEATHAPLINKAVVLTGTIKNDLSQIISKKEKCPADYGREESMQQIRSDWVGEETGFHVGHSTREKLSKLPYFEYQKIEAFSGIKTYQQDNKQIVVFKNTLGKKIEKLEIIAHYEGGWGKPQPGFVDREFKMLGNDEQIEVSFEPTLKEENSRPGRPSRAKRLQSVIIKGSGKNLKIKLEIFTVFRR